MVDFNLLDPNAPAKVGDSFFAGQRNAMAMRRAQTGQQMNELALQQKQKGIADNASSNQAYQQSGGDPNKLPDALRSAGLYKEAIGAQANLIAVKKSKVEEGLQHFKIADAIMANVNDQKSFDFAKQRIVSLFGQDALQHLPEQYDQNIIEQAKSNAMGIKGQLEQHWKQLDYQQKQDAATQKASQFNTKENRLNTQNAASNKIARDKLDNPMGLKSAGQNYGVKGDALLSRLDQPVAAQVKALAEGRMKFPAGFALKSPYWQNMVSLVSQYDPSFDSVNYNSRNKTRSDFTSGKSADNMAAINTAIQHLGKLSGDFEKLKNTYYPSINAATNFLGNQLENKEIQGNFAAVSTDSTAVAHELAKVFRQTGMSEGEINDWAKKISPNASPARGTITVRTGQKGDEVWVEISDTGKGISQAQLKKVFDPFFTTKPIGKGTGLGLSLSYGIIQKHHGRIEVQSEVGLGTIFRVWLPVKQA